MSKEDPPRPDGVEMYRGTRERVLELGRGLSDEQAEAVVAATPEWTVRDNFAHLAGAADDVLAGRLEGVATDEWTAAQVEARRGRSLGEILEELEELGPRMDELIGALGDAMDPRLFIDQWTHEQDVRGALGIPGGGDSPVVPWGGGVAAHQWVRRVAKAGLPTLRVLSDGRERVSSDDAPAATLSVDPFTALRVLVGRRSAAQIAALDWSGSEEPSTYLDALVLFSVPQADVLDAR